MNKIAIVIFSTLLTTILGVLAWIGTETISYIKPMHKTLTEIQINMAIAIVKHQELERVTELNHKGLEKRVDNVEKKVYGRKKSESDDE